MQLATLSILFVLLPLMLISLLIGVYVYKDSLRRGMNAVLWTLVAVFAPALIGLIIYLLVRGNYSDLTCPSCAAKVASDFVVCPRCGAKLKYTCPSCNKPCESDWKMCPQCASPLPEQPWDITPPVKKKDRTLGKILTAVIAVPVFLLVVLIFSFSVYGFSSAGSGSMGTAFMSAEEYVKEKNSPEITQWIESCSSEREAVYALRYKTEEDGQKVTNYAVYFPFDLFESIKTSTKSGFFNPYANVEFGGNPQHPFIDERYNFLLLSTQNSSSFLDLKASYNGKDVPCIVVDVEYDPAITNFS